jgi:hypothetical protein
VIEVAEFYTTLLERKIGKVRERYGEDAKIIILGYFNARVGIDGVDKQTEECNAQREKCTIGTFDFIKANVHRRCTGTKPGTRAAAGKKQKRFNQYVME